VLPDPGYLGTAVAGVVLVTLALRALPFTVIAAWRQSALVGDLADWMPLGVLLILVVDSLSMTSFTTAPYGLPEVVALLLTIALHLWRRNTSLSVVVGTAGYLVLVNVALPTGGWA